MGVGVLSVLSVLANPIVRSYESVNARNGGGAVMNEQGTMGRCNTFTVKI